MCNETRWRIVCDDTPAPDDPEFTATPEVAALMAENQLAVNAELGLTENVRAVRAAAV